MAATYRACIRGMAATPSLFRLLRVPPIQGRLALGSTTSAIFSLIVREGLLLVAGGLVLGLAGMLALRQALQSRLYGLGAMDPLVIVIVMAALAMIALAACSLPARRASQVDPVAVLNPQ